MTAVAVVAAVAAARRAEVVGVVEVESHVA
jgi:hypothetical protein